jgi:methyl-accepting chemotaxis protein
MNFIRSAKISLKIASLLVLMGIITIGVAIMGSRQLLHADAGYSQLTDVKLPNTVLSVRVNRRVSDMLYAGYRTMAYDGSSAIAQAAAKAEDEAYQDAVKMLAEMRDREPANAAKFDEMKADITAIQAHTAKAVRAGLANDDSEAKRELGEADPLAVTFNTMLKSYNNARIADGKAVSAALSVSAASTSRWLLTLSILGVIGGVGGAIIFSTLTITRPLTRTTEVMGRLAHGQNDVDVAFTDRGDEVGAIARSVLVFRDMAVAKAEADAVKARSDAEQKMVVETVAGSLGTLADGDLTKSIETDFPPAYAELKNNFNQAVDSLRTLIGSVSSTALTVRTGSDEIAHASEDLARRTEGNAASLEETSAAIHQIDSRLKATAEAADRSVAGSELTLTAVGEGRSRTDQAVQAMGRVSDSAKGIDSVIEGLDKIAFQTRVLAMNAAVEAGRAGDAGRGFAVVADLVSALAMRAEEEAKRARDQLTVTQAEIVAAVDAVEKVDGALGDISNASSEAAALARQIAADNQAQASAISQVSTAIGQMDEATQQNAAMVEETSAAARNLTTEVANLTNQAAQFKVGNAAPSAAPTPTRVPAKPASTRRSPTKVASYQSPVPQLPAKAVSALTRPQDEDWNAF